MGSLRISARNDSTHAGVLAGAYFGSVRVSLAPVHASLGQCKIASTAEDEDNNRRRQENTGLIRTQAAVELCRLNQCRKTLFGYLGSLCASVEVNHAREICNQHKAAFNYDEVGSFYETAIENRGVADNTQTTWHGAYNFVRIVLDQTVLDDLEKHLTDKLASSLIPFFKFGQILEALLSPPDFALRSRRDRFDTNFDLPESKPDEWDENAEPDGGRLAIVAVPVGGHRVDGGSTTILKQAWFSIAENHDNDAFKAVFAQLDGVRNTAELTQVVTSLHQLAVNRISELAKHDARPGESYFDGQVRLDLEKRIVSREGTPDSDELKPQLVGVLGTLLEKAGETCSHDDLIEVAGIEKEGPANERKKLYKSPERKRLNVAISETRAICKPLGIAILSKSGVGYYVVLTTPSQSQ